MCNLLLVISELQMIEASLATEHQPTMDQPSTSDSTSTKCKLIPLEPVSSFCVQTPSVKEVPMSPAPDMVPPFFKNN